MARNIVACLGLALMNLAYNCTIAFAVTVYTSKKYDLNIFISSPPALIFVQDSKNNITGADPSKGLDTLGRGTSIQEIPGSWVEQDNVASDAINGVSEPSESTSWVVNIPDFTAQSFTINLQGVTVGITELSVAGMFYLKSKIPMLENDLEILSTRGVTKQVKVTFDIVGRTMTSTLIIHSGDFLRDTQSACALGNVKPVQACEALERIASEVEEGSAKGNAGLERTKLDLYLHVLERLRHWDKAGAQEGWDDMKANQECAPLWGSTWNGKHVFVDEQTFAALELDAKTLLNAVPTSDKDEQKDGKQ